MGKNKEDKRGNEERELRKRSGGGGGGIPLKKHHLVHQRNSFIDNDDNDNDCEKICEKFRNDREQKIDEKKREKIMETHVKGEESWTTRQRIKF